MSVTALEITGLSKKFCRDLKQSMRYGSYDIVRQIAGMRIATEKLRRSEFWALSEVSFEVKQGEAVGVIGPNGAGKSTLLKLISGIIFPDKGVVKTNGKVNALIELGTGFHPVLTGRENIYVNASILGMPKRAIDAKIDDIIDFAGIGQFIDTPVKYYSSGMFARLGFSIVVHANPDILLIDEILSVGDFEFREKSLNFLKSLHKNGKTIIFVGHSLYQVEVFCTRTLFLHRGSLLFDGPTKQAMNEYISLSHSEGVLSETSAESLDRSGEYPLSIKKLEFLDHNNQVSQEFEFGSDFAVRVHYVARQPISRPLFNLRILHKGIDIAEIAMLIDGFGPEEIVGEGYVDCKLKKVTLTPKSYDLFIFVRSSNGIVDIAEPRICEQFQIDGKNLTSLSMQGPMAFNHFTRKGVCYIEREWNFYDASGKKIKSLSSKK